MKKIIVLFVSLFIFIPSVFAYEKEVVTLSSCVDGDTATFIYNGSEAKFRFLSIDTPESVHPEKEVQFMGKEASEYTCGMLTNASKIEVLFDEKGNNTDKYGRYVAWIYVDDILLQSDLVSKGYAEVAYVYYKYAFVPNLCELQKQAKDKRLGIWNSNRQEGYCVTKSNAKVDNESVKTKEKYDYKKIMIYISEGKFDKALEYLINNTTNMIVLSVLFVLLILLTIIKTLKKKKRR